MGSFFGKGKEGTPTNLVTQEPGGAATTAAGMGQQAQVVRPEAAAVGLTDCEQDCQNEWSECIKRPAPDNENCDADKAACVNRCHGVEGFCTGGYIESNRFRACRAGFEPRIDPQGNRWCCPTGSKQFCKTKEDCLPDEDCVDGKCVKKEKPKPEGCPYGTGPEWAGCACGKKYPASDASKCVAGYVWIKKVNEPEGGQCECSKWCEEIGWGTDCKTYTGKPQLGEFKWPEELSSLYQRLMGRAGEYMARKPGYSDAILRALMTRGTETLRGGEAQTRERMLADLQAEGLLGTGAAQTAMQPLYWQTQKGVADLTRDIGFAQEEQKRKDLESYTKMAADLFARGASFKQVEEAINAARRGEGQQALAMLLSYLGTLMSGWR